VAVLVLDASPGEYEMSMEGGGQAKEHALLARNFGITQLVVAINKMDGPRVRWSRERFDAIVASVTPLLTGMGFKREGLTFVPVSGLTGINLVRTPAEVAAAGGAGGGGAVSRQSTASEGSAPEHASWAATSGAGAAAAAAGDAAAAGRGAGARGTAAGAAADSAAAGIAGLHRNASERHRESRALHSHSHDHDDSGGGVWGSRDREAEELDPDMADMLEGLGLSRQEIAAAATSKKQQQAAAQAGAGAGAGPVTSWAVEGAAAGPREGGGGDGLSRLPSASSAGTASSAGSGAASAARGAAAAAGGGGGHVMARQSSFDAAAVDSDISAMLLSADSLRPEEVGRLSEWYTGPTLLQALEAVRAPPRLLDRPLRLCVADVYRSPVAGLTVAGRIEGGWLVPHTKLVVVPGASGAAAGGR
jgi:hypothetical protein